MIRSETELDDLHYRYGNCRKSLDAIERSIFKAVRARMMRNPGLEECHHNDGVREIEAMRQRLASLEELFKQCAGECVDEIWWERDKAELNEEE